MQWTSRYGAFWDYLTSGPYEITKEAEVEQDWIAVYSGETIAIGTEKECMAACAAHRAQNQN